MNTATLIRHVLLASTMQRRFIMKVNGMIKATIQAVILSCAPSFVYAEVKCLSPTNSALSSHRVTMPLQTGVLSVGPDVPMGTVVYRQRYNPTKSFEQKCMGVAKRERLPPRFQTITTPPSFIMHFNHTYTNLPLPLSNWNSGPFAGKVYQTGVPGLGVTFTDVNDKPFPFTTAPQEECIGNRISGTGNCVMPYRDRSTVELKLIKIGDVSPGVIQSASLPQVAVEMHVVDNLPLSLQVATSGSISMLATTCNTSDITVPMGSYSIGDFTGVNSATDWKNFNIALTNCPAFVGSRLTREGAQWDDNNSWGAPLHNRMRFSRSGTASHNMQFRIDPVRMAINTSDGILSLDSSHSGQAQAATGIGVQIASSTGANLRLAVNLNTGLHLLATPGNYNIPLRARYQQTAATVTPGPANATATFTIIYQ